jgi:hypothetical protein
MRGYDKQTVKKQDPKTSDPVFKMTMNIEDLEVLGNCERYEEATDNDAGLSKIVKNLYKEQKINLMPDSRTAKGTGPGFGGEELLSKDELNLIMDLEDEQRRLGGFKLIYPKPSNASLYYGLFEVKRY